MKSNFRRWVRAVALVLFGIGLAARADMASLFTNLNGRQPAGRPRVPSIIFIQCDSIGYLDLSCYGQKQFQTPNLDRIAAGGLLFTNYEAAGEDAAATRAAMLLGQPGSAGLPAERPTIAQVLDKVGYFTGYIGEWPFGEMNSPTGPHQKGFYEFAGYFNPDEAGDYYADSMWRYIPNGILNTNNNHWEDYSGREGLMKNAGGNHGQYIPDLYTKAVLRFIGAHTPDLANHYRPFFLWVNYATPRPNKKEFDRTGNGLQVPTDAPYSDQPWPAAEKSKAAMIARLDNDMGQLMESIKTRGMTNNLLFVFSSATVPRKAAGLDPQFFPSVVSTNDLRLPMIAWWPEHIPAGKVSGEHFSAANIFATAADLGIAPYPTNEVAPSILAALTGRSAPAPR